MALLDIIILILAPRGGISKMIMTSRVILKMVLRSGEGWRFDCLGTVSEAGGWQVAGGYRGYYHTHASTPT